MVVGLLVCRLNLGCVGGRRWDLVLVEAVLVEAVLVEAVLMETVLMETVLVEAVLMETVLVEAVLMEAVLMEAVLMDDLVLADLVLVEAVQSLQCFSSEAVVGILLGAKGGGFHGEAGGAEQPRGADSGSARRHCVAPGGAWATGPLNRGSVAGCNAYGMENWPVNWPVN